MIQICCKKRKRRLFRPSKASQKGDGRKRREEKDGEKQGKGRETEKRVREKEK